MSQLNTDAVKRNRRQLNKPRIVPNVYKTRKRFKPQPAVVDAENDNDFDDVDFGLLSDTYAALLLLSSEFPREAYSNKIPAVVLRHHLYSVVKNRTMVDQQLNELVVNGDVLLFNLSSGVDQFAVVIKKDFIAHIKKTVKDTENKILDIYFDKILELNDPTVRKEYLMDELHLRPEDLTEYVRRGLMVFNDISSYWISIPGIGPMINELKSGRKEMIGMIQKTKHHEMLESDLLNKKLKKSRLQMSFHINDLIGTDVVTCTDTAVGRSLRLKKSH